MQMAKAEQETPIVGRGQINMLSL